ncbi:uncharacterized protein DDB_G0287625-like [Leptidea sinapis]|uniref:uncharacterized protein DDB_G0287625-like n=1 Tax=Leptidea sinapis TaxID=189913 RepID=UPI0021C45C37|nr:uncharacterized protein DDB_G0287625-like [Leptidea sinapis]
MANVAHNEQLNDPTYERRNDANSPEPMNDNEPGPSRWPRHAVINIMEASYDDDSVAVAGSSRRDDPDDPDDADDVVDADEMRKIHEEVGRCSGTDEKERNASANPTRNGKDEAMAEGGDSEDDTDAERKRKRAERRKKKDQPPNPRLDAKRMRFGATLVSSEEEEDDDEDDQDDDGDDTDKGGAAVQDAAEPSQPEANNTDGPSTSRDGPADRYVRFRRNQNPVYVNCAPVENHIHVCGDDDILERFAVSIRNRMPIDAEQMRLLSEMTQRYAEDLAEERERAIREGNAENRPNGEGPNERPVNPENRRNENHDNENRPQINIRCIIRQNRPNVNRPNENRPDGNIPDENRADVNRPGENRPGENRPDVNRPNDNRPDENRPNVNRPNVNRPNANRPNVNRPNVNRPNVNRPNVNRPNVNRAYENRPNQNRRYENPNENGGLRFQERLRGIDFLVEPCHHVLCLSVAPESCRAARSVLTTDPHLDTSGMVTDFSIRRFGYADGEGVNFVHLGRDGPVAFGRQAVPTRPERSSLRVLSVTGYTNVTDHSMTHLSTAAPYLNLLDVRGTAVTSDGVDHFKSLRPDCEVKHGKLEEPE